jgi:hypothetical protein
MASPAEPPFDGDVDSPVRRFFHRWAGPPSGQPAAWDTDSRSEIRWRWGEVCAGFDLSRRVLPDDGPRSIPHIGRITLGPPTRFTVRLRPGLRRQHIVDIAPQLALAFEVDEVHVRDLASGWLSVELVEQPAFVPGPAELTLVGSPDTVPDAVERRTRQAGPRSLRWWPHHRRSRTTDAGA